MWIVRLGDDMEDRRQFLKKTAVIAALELGKAAMGAEPAREYSTKAEETIKSKDIGAAGASSGSNDIRKLSQHFSVPGGDIAPWMFIPAENLKEISTREHPGL